jgi:HPt (histidine-containing phosphotransfer) domain-containing protein
MDGYVNKPIQLSKLKAEIQRVIDGHGDVPIAADTVTRNGAVDAKELMERIGGDRSLLRELIGFFQTESASQVGTCQSALGTLKAEEVERAGHTLKGMLANLAAPEAMKLAARLEEMGRNRELADADSTLTKLKVELSRVEDSLETLCNGAG